MRIAVHAMAAAERPISEAEQFRRLAIACERRGWACLRSDDTAAIEEFRPDLVLAEHFLVPKLTPFPTVGLLWNPPFFWDGKDEAMKNIVSYDGHLFADPQTRRHVRDLVAGLPVRFVEGRWVPSCQATPLAAGRRDGLAYFEAAWDRARHRDIVAAVARYGWLHLYGPPDEGDPPGLPRRLMLPFDGESVVRELGRRAAALCLHSGPHRRTGTPASRVFEAAAGGAVVIADAHPFVRETFGDAALYLDSEAPPAAVAAAVARHMEWIAANPEAADAMRAAAHRIFTERFAYDVLVDQLPGLAAEIRAAWASPPAVAAESVTCIVRTGGRDLALLDRALASLEQQTHPAVAAVVVAWRDAAAVTRFVAERPASRLRVRVVASPDTGCRSTALWTGLGAIDTAFFAVLDDDDTLMPNHLAGCLAVLAAHPDVDLAYAGTVAVDETRASRTLLWFSHFDPARFRAANTIASHAWVARARLLPAAGPDPDFVVAEDWYLLLRFACAGRIAPSWRLTAEYRRRDGDPSHSALAEALPASLDRIRRRFHFSPVRPEEPRPEAAIGEDAARIIRRMIRRRQFRKGLTAYLRDLRGLPGRLAALPAFLSRHGLKGLLRRIADRGVRPGR
ncbi:glycosyltransferase [Rhodoplanes sp. TEM]|uniref:Glycosyltransferase n=1 Tax=Rhodoplanes tepidamans TaxID=200616 RepID=A0ABT5J315_RHOTP|nr:MULTISPECIES: glycosyltransferase [Rhodoplanes]MDC7784074.1 glycosyltransferase [Rhodoplanes tepidamans]MDC7983169.1 glycosyltransferase [Rhodoplanes sp. TEM]MDQ0356830.1 phosphoglycerol transferase [Rhodoplanes tepidamans]